MIKRIFIKDKAQSNKKCPLSLGPSLTRVDFSEENERDAALITAREPNDVREEGCRKIVHAQIFQDSQPE
jgi:hypothetical protein